ncbi:xanthine dehydrogenase family protein molybdopterin-binding subunit [Hansschlegelia sp.]|uniref:xanthine dehydrogenase family protein molybdopterin-binding subunit n=1 Tax=Hansschlegelia sp. TaxID=2041892 RepID=UPI002C34C8C6|nr:xanthine dehydrogenase family protein molybdopterin-binding subunit [Hansschlegelia sp.]HVI29572.1 xanthine dehydrogenase family protein molybdopterin-binding subunit [Hansschlegelia sp.]
MSNVQYVGGAQPRVDGPLKVSGLAKYAGEFPAEDLAYGVVVSSSVAKGRIRRLDLDAARATPGVVAILTHADRPTVTTDAKKHQDQAAPPGFPFIPLHDDRIVYSGQPVALVVAESFEAARDAAALVRVEYETEPAVVDVAQRRDAAYDPPEKRDGVPPPPPPRGDADAAFSAAPVKISGDYRIAVEHHNPMEMHASTVFWDRGKLVVHDKVQGVTNTKAFVVNVFGLPEDDVRVLSPFVGGAFGSGLRPQYQLTLAVMAALRLKRSVRVTLTRDQMFTFTYRPDTLQTVALSADSDGRLQSIRHDAVACTSTFEDYQEAVVNWSGLIYACDNVSLSYRLAKIDTYTPGDMRAPGATTGVYALEAAMDELAYAAKVDPLELRLRNYADHDQNDDKPFSSKELRACYERGAQAFGWSRRSAEPRSMRDGRDLVGLGMATGCWEAMMQPHSARATLTPEGKLEVACATADIGTGTYTILAQIGADAMGLPIEDVVVRIGDSSLPMAPVEGGSWAAASAGSAVQAACRGLREQILTHARALENSPLANASLDHVVFSGGGVALAADPARSVPYGEALRASGLQRLEANADFAPDEAFTKKFAAYTHSAVFVEVRVDEELGVIRVSRVVSAIAAGKILNQMTARSQILGGVVMGIGMALHEESMPDRRLGRFMNHNYGEYHVPANADIHDIEVIFVDEIDEANSLGIKGLGEIGIVGTAAAVANAIFHATGRRVRDLPITPDKLL